MHKGLPHAWLLLQVVVILPRACSFRPTTISMPLVPRSRKKRALSETVASLDAWQGSPRNESNTTENRVCKIVRRTLLTQAPVILGTMVANTLLAKVRRPFVEDMFKKIRLLSLPLYPLGVWCGSVAWPLTYVVTFGLLLVGAIICELSILISCIPASIMATPFIPGNVRLQQNLVRSETIAYKFFSDPIFMEDFFMNLCVGVLLHITIPFAEEYVFREFLQRFLQRKEGTNRSADGGKANKRSYIFVSVAFGLSHLNGPAALMMDNANFFLVQGLMAGVSSFVLYCPMYDQYGLFGSTMAHITWNACAAPFLSLYGNGLGKFRGL
mmetsp:Transcript_39095/g.87460  ORF Transcript_39095/g.87460 Transcript_39095/m.87460 type:complete len:326 (-) Transcript_39095:44-1021(-)